MLQRELDRQLAAARALEEIAHDLNSNLNECVTDEYLDQRGLPMADGMMAMLENEHEMRDLVVDMSATGELDELLFAIKLKNAEYSLFVLCQAVMRRVQRQNND